MANFHNQNFWKSDEFEPILRTFATVSSDILKLFSGDGVSFKRIKRGSL